MRQSSNRINVALSRAKHGLIVLGNASNLRKNKTWSTVLDEMEVRGQIGPGIPIVCPRHPDQTQVVSNPGELDRFAPGGGCLLPCGTQLPCGHICPSVVSPRTRPCCAQNEVLILITFSYSVMIHETSIVAPYVTCLARRYRAHVIIRARRDVSRIAGIACSLSTTYLFRAVMSSPKYPGTCFVRVIAEASSETVLSFQPYAGEARRCEVYC